MPSPPFKMPPPKVPEPSSSRIIPAQYPAMQLVMPVGGFLTLGCVIAGSQALMKHLEKKEKEKEAAEK